MLFKILMLKTVVCDSAYDSNRVHEQIIRAKKKAVIPPRANRKKPEAYNKPLYREQNLAERFVNRIKQFRAVATHYEKLVIMFSGLLTVIFIAICL